jgi:uncharacterized protein
VEDKNLKCPNDGATLVMSDRQGIEIDYCPECRGVWLDRGELDKIIERSSSADKDRAAASSYTEQQSRHDNRQTYHDDHEDYGHKKRKKEGFLGDLFDF